MKKLRSLLTLILCLALAASLTATAMAASVPFSSSKPAKTFCLASSGRVQVYTDAACSKTGGTEYIDCATDEILVLQWDSKNNSVLVRYPVPGGTKDRWIRVNQIIPGSFANAQVVTLTRNVQGYRWSTGSAEYGYAEAGDTVWLLGTQNSRTFVMWPISSGYRIAACNTSELNSAIPSSKPAAKSASLAFDWPMKNAVCTWKGPGANMSWAEDSCSGNARSYHLGCDIYGSTGDVMAAADGVVAACSSSVSGANGRYVILRHNVGGKTVYTFYAHLSSVSVSNGASVKRGQRIGAAGGSGYGSNSYYGVHLHFAVMDTLWNSGDYYGYAYAFSGNAKYFEGVTYYNPKYVVENDRIPG